MSEKKRQKSPEANTELPVARVLEARIHRHYGWEFYWPEMFAAKKDASEEIAASEHDPYLRSTKVLTDISAVTDTDADFGVIDDFLIDAESWRIPFVEAHRPKTGRILLSTELIRNIDVASRRVQVASPW